jgi:hypothetical protein
LSLKKPLKWLIAIVVALLTLLALLIGVAYWLLHTDTPDVAERDAPLVPRLSGDYPGAPRTVDAEQLLSWAERATPMARINTATDSLPNGLALSMLPFMVDWEQSRTEGDSPFLLMRNVNAGGNPVIGENILATVRIPLDGLSGLHWCLTPTRNDKGKDTFMGHAMLRFLFSKEKRPVILGQDGQPLPGALAPDDLMLSWEAWRPPMTSYDGLKGLDPESYTLSARAYTGAQRFLTDIVRGNPWRCYPVKLPEVDNALPLTLLTATLSGDTFARRIIGEMAAKGQIKAEGLRQATPAQRERVKSLFATSRLPKDPLSGLLQKANLSYQLLERSCITESLAMIQLSLDRIHKEHDLGPPPKLELVPSGLPPWIQELVTADHATLLAHVPGTLLFVARNRQVLPIQAYRILEEAGLLLPNPSSDADGPLMYYYDKSSGMPYGSIKDNMM